MTQNLTNPTERAAPSPTDRRCESARDKGVFFKSTSDFSQLIYSTLTDDWSCTIIAALECKKSKVELQFPTSLNLPGFSSLEDLKKYKRVEIDLHLQKLVLKMCGWVWWPGHLRSSIPHSHQGLLTQQQPAEKRFAVSQLVAHKVSFTIRSLKFRRKLTWRILNWLILKLVLNLTGYVSRSQLQTLKYPFHYIKRFNHVKFPFQWILASQDPNQLVHWT